nr:hypothetical protein [Spirochaetota bacterium]
MTQQQADDICRMALPFNVYSKIEQHELIAAANSIMFYCVCMVKKATYFECDLEFKINFKNKLFDGVEANEA